jgi:hypothetical protein
MIKVGDIVFRKRSGGLIKESENISSSIGLVIKDHRETGAIPQFYVQFDQQPPKWFYQHHLSKIQWKKK